jgi:hypothetical protein
MVFDDHALQWITSYLHNGRQCVQLNDVQSSMQNVPHRIPQGLILGLFFVIFISDLLMHIDNAEVDLFESVDYTEIQQLRKTVDESITGVNDWAVANKMTLNQKKTKAMLITGKRLSAKMETKLLDLQYEQVSSAKLLGLHMDKELTFNEHVHAICKKLAKRIGTLKRIRGCLPMHQRLLYYNHVIKPIMMYSSAVCTNCRKDYMDMVFQLQKRAARVILDAPYMSLTIQLFNRLKWLPFYEQSKVNKAVFAFKSINGKTAPYLRETLKLNCEQHCRNTRYAEVNFICPKYKRETEGGRTFSVTIIKLWNSPPLNLRQHLNVRIFKNEYVEIVHAHQQSLSHL